MWVFLFSLASGQSELDDLPQVLEDIQGNIGAISEDDALWLRHTGSKFYSVSCSPFHSNNNNNNTLDLSISHSTVQGGNNNHISYVPPDWPHLGEVHQGSGSSSTHPDAPPRPPSSTSAHASTSRHAPMLPCPHMLPRLAFHLPPPVQCLPIPPPPIRLTPSLPMMRIGPWTRIVLSTGG